jgi:alpha-1,2-mannosyltransferase
MASIGSAQPVLDVASWPDGRPAGLAARRWFTLALVALFALLALQYYLKISEVLGHDKSQRHQPIVAGEETRSAVLRWRNQILALGEGTDIWQAFLYPNPPIMALLLWPLAQLPPVAYAMLWFLLKSAMACLAVVLTFRMIETPDRPLRVWAKVVVVLLSLRALESDLIHGNVNIFILFLLVAALFVFYRGKDFLAGLLLALAIACKLTPVLFVPYFLWKRAWRCLAGCAAGLVVFLFLVPGLFLGMQRNAVYLQSWVEKMVLPFVVKGEITSEHINQSLPGVLYRLAGHYPSFCTFRGHDPVPLDYHNILDLDESTLRWLLNGSMGIFALLVLWSCRTPLSSRQGWALLAEFGIVVLGMLLFSERTWKHHCVTLLVPLAAIGHALSAPRLGRPWRICLGATLVAAAILLFSTSTGLFGSHNQVGKLAQVYGAFTWVFLLLLAALTAMLRRARQITSCAPESAAILP